MDKVIMHYDMDAFYASVEIRDNPKYKDLPIVVGGGVVSTASYEARKYGVHSAMSIFEAKKLCPNLIVIYPDKEKYSKISQKIQNLVLKITPKAEFVALDEGYVDVTEAVKKFSSLENFAKKFQKRIWYHTNLTCSVGIGMNMLSAKIGSGINKPGGVYIFKNQQDFVEYISKKDVRIIQGVGRKFESELKKDGIIKVEDIFPYSLKELVARYGKSRGELLYLSSRGIDYREIEYKRQTHSIGNENTYRLPLESEESVRKEMLEIFEYSYERLLKEEHIAKTVILKIKYRDGTLITRSKTFSIPTDEKEILYESLETLLDLVKKEGIKLLGVAFGNLTKKSIMQLSIFKV